MSWKIHVYGTRGSFPQPDNQYMEYGGNTSCFYVDCGQHLILDAGSGLSSIEEIYRDSDPVHILLSHVHMDHVIGLFQCKAFFEKGREIHIYSKERNGKNIEEQLRRIVAPPYWPVGFDDFSANINFHTVEDAFQIGNIHTSVIPSCHPDNSSVFRIEDTGNRAGYALDYEMAMDTEERIVSFLQNCDLIVFDGNYIPGDEVFGWGHSTWKDAIRVRRKSESRKIIISHYGYHYTDQMLRQQELMAKKEDKNCIFAREGMVIES